MCGRMFSQISIIDEDLGIRGLNLAALAFKVNGLIRLLSVSLMLTHLHSVGYKIHLYECL